MQNFSRFPTDSRLTDCHTLYSFPGNFHWFPHSVRATFLWFPLSLRANFLWFPPPLQVTFSGFLTLSGLFSLVSLLILGQLSLVSPLSPGYFLWFRHSLKASFSGFLTHFEQTFSGFLSFSSLLSLDSSLPLGKLSLVSSLSPDYFLWFPHFL